MSDDELELARVAQEEFELFDDSYYDDLYDGDGGLDGDDYDDLYDGDGGLDGDDYDAQCFGCDRSDVLGDWDEIAW